MPTLAPRSALARARTRALMRALTPTAALTAAFALGLAGCSSPAKAPGAAVDAAGGAVGSSDSSADSASGGGWSKDAAGKDAGAGDDGAAVDAGVAALALDGPAFFDDAVGFGLSVTETYAHCTLAADFDGDGDLDLGLVPTAFVAGKGWIAALRVHLLEAGAIAQTVDTPIDTSLLVPNTGCGVVDFNDDGRPDVIVGGVGGMRIYANATLPARGAGAAKLVFSDVTDTLVPDFFERDVWSIASGDLNGDGRPDLVFGNGLVYGACADVSCAWDDAEFFCSHPPPAPAQRWADLKVLRDTLWLGKDAGPPLDASALLTALPDGELSQIVPFDLDADGHVDLLAGHDFGAHGVLRATGKGGYVLVRDGMRGAGHTMGWAAADFDGDGRSDVVMSDLGPVALYRQQPAALPAAMTFTDIGASWGIHALTADLSSWTPLAEDFDHDGHVDVFLGTSAVAEPGTLVSFVACVGAQKPAAAQYDLLFHNRGDHFDGHQVAAPMTKLGIERLAQTAVDVDGDGDLDILQVRFDGVVRLLRNALPTAGGAVFFDIRGVAGNRLATGARLEAKVGGRVVQRQVQAALGFGGGARLRLHVPTPAGAALEDVRVYYPAPLGVVRKLGRIEAGSGVVVVTPFGS